MNIWEIMYEKFLFNKSTITLFESFAGIGSFHKSLTILSKECDFTLNVVGISEIDKYAIAAYNEIHGETKNYGNICDIQEIPQVDIFTYSFPCQDISLAGKGKGFSKGSGTRSGLLWEVERILENQQKINKLPQVLVMENVKALVGMKFKDDFIEWQLKLQELGYTSYWEVLNAKNYGIPQNRERVFMVSILGEYYYEFPKPFELKLRLKDMLEDEVNEKYYLSDKQMKFLETNNNNSNVKGNLSGGKWDKINESSRRVYNIETYAPTIHTMGGGNTEPKIYCSYALGSREHEAQGWKEIMPTLAARDYKDPKVVLIPEATKKGYAEATDGDGVYINRPHQKRGVVQKGMIQTIKTSGDIGVVDDMRIRKLTPKECYRLMGFTDQDYEKAASVCSNTQLYKQAGNSIVVDVVYYLFKEMIKWKKTL